MSDKKASKVDFGIFKRLLNYAKPYKLYLFLALFFTVIISITVFFRPTIIGQAVQLYVVNEETRSL